MSMSTHVIAFRPPDEAWGRHKRVWDAREAAEVEVPTETMEFFNYEDPDDAGVEVSVPVRRWVDVGRDGYELSVSDIPAGVTILRFYNAW